MSNYLLEKHYRGWLVLLSFFVSFLGAYTTTQLYVQCRQSRHRTETIAWLALASIAFGGCGIWSFHFVAMIALDIQVSLHFNVPLTMFSAVIAVIGTMMGLASNIMIRQDGLGPMDVYSPIAGGTARSSMDFDHRGAMIKRTSTPLDGDGSEDEDQMLEMGGVVHISSTRSSRAPSERPKKPIHVRLMHHLWWSLNVQSFIVGGVMGLTIVAMHYCGMKAMFFDGEIQYNGFFVALSIIISYVVSMVAIIFMPNDSDVVRQVVFSLCAALGINLMHWTGIVAATFYSDNPPQHETGTVPTVLPLSVAFVSIITCLLSYVVLARTITQSRDRLVEMVVTKRRLWKAIAEKEAAERNDKVKTEFISVASHELRTPLHAITGFTDLLAMTELDEEQQSFVRTIKASCHALDLITKNVLDFTKLENESAETSARNTDVAIKTLARDMMQTCTIRISPQASVELILVIDSDVPSIFSTDETYFARILMNLVGNALKFTKDGYVLCRIWTKEDSLCVSVTDTGCGIAPESQRIIFEPFRQADTSLTRTHLGTGLGLAICRQLVSKMGGRISLQSEENRGSEFTVVLPGLPRHSNNHLPPVQSNIRVALLLRSSRTTEIVNQSLSAKFSVTVIEPSKWSTRPNNTADRWLADVDCITPQILSFIESSTNSETWFIFHADAGATLKRLRKLPNVSLIRRPICIDDAFIRQIRIGRIVTPSTPLLESGPTLIPLTPPIPQSPSLVPTSINSNISQKTSSVAKASTSEIVPPPADATEVVLLVEDNPVNQHLGLKMLAKLSLPSDLAANGRIALDLILAKPERYNLILMDCQMPVLNGFEATKQIREWERKGEHGLGEGRRGGRIRIISLTANVSARSREECEEAGSDQFLPKPLTLRSLREEVTKVLAMDFGQKGNNEVPDGAGH